MGKLEEKSGKFVLRLPKSEYAVLVAEARAKGISIKQHVASKFPDTAVVVDDLEIPTPGRHGFSCRQG